MKVDGNFTLGPTHNPAPEMTVKEGVPQGEVFNFTMESTDSKFYPGIAREANTFARPDPADPTKLLVMSHPAPYTRKLAVYVPKQYVAGTAAPFIVGADGPDKALFTALDGFPQRRHALASPRTDPQQRRWLVSAQGQRGSDLGLDLLGAGQVGLVQHHDVGHFQHARFLPLKLIARFRL